MWARLTFAALDEEEERARPRRGLARGPGDEAQVRQIEDALLEWLEIERAC